MDNSALLLGFVESAIGKGKQTSGKNYAFYCPICQHRKPKLEVDFDTEFYHCWTCQPALKGRSIVSLLKRLKVSEDKIREVKRYSKYKDTEKPKENLQEIEVKLPADFKLLSEYSSGIKAKHYLHYLRSRGISDRDILKYKIGYSDTGKYRNSVIIPSYDKDGKLNYFISRSIEADTTRKYNAPKCDKKSIIGFESYVNWNVPIVLVEGIFDAIAVRRNAIPLFGKSITEGLMKELVKSEVKIIYICLDKDAIKDALDYSQKLLNLGKIVYLVELDDKDPSDIGFERMLTFLKEAKPLGLYDIAKKRLERI